jgi:hypothetical protein
VFTLVFSIQYHGNGQIELNGNGPSFKEIFNVGIQAEFSIMPSFQYTYFGSEYVFNKPSTSRFFEIGIVTTWRLSKRLDFIFGAEYRKVNRFSHDAGYKYSPFVGPSGQLQRIEGLHHWDRDFKSNALSITWGLSYEVFKFSKFDLTLHAAYGRNFILSASDDFQYITTEFERSNMENSFRTVMDERPPNYIIDESFNSLETGIGMKFNRFSYEIIISTSDENLANAHFGGRIRYLFL